MKHFLFLAIGLCIFCACHKSEPVAPKTVVYPYSDQFTGTLHVSHKYEYWMPLLNYDSTYTQKFEIVHLDSNRAFFNFFYWDQELHIKNGVASYSRVLTSISSITATSGQGQLTMKINCQGDAVVSNDSLLVNYPAITSASNNLTITFAGKKM